MWTFCIGHQCLFQDFTREGVHLLPIFKGEGDTNPRGTIPILRQLLGGGGGVDWTLQCYPYIVRRCTDVQCLLCYAMIVCYQKNSFPWVIPSVKLFWFSHCVYHQSPIILPIFTECLSPFMERLLFSFTIANTVAHMYMCVHGSGSFHYRLYELFLSNVWAVIHLLKVW